MSALVPAMLLALAATPVTVQVDGPLKDALRTLAKEGGLNLVVEGNLDQPVQVNLAGLPAEEALESLAKVYKLDVEKSGKLWVVRKAAPASAAAEGVAAPLPPLPALPPAPPAPPSPPGPAGAPQVKVNGQDIEQFVKEKLGEAGVSSESADAQLEKARDQLEAARDAAERAREEAEQAREIARELAEAQREKARNLKEAALERAKKQGADTSDRVGQGPVVVAAGTIVDSATAFGGPVIIEKGAVVEGDAVSFGGDVVLKDDAVVEGDAVSFGGQVLTSAGAVVRGESAQFGEQGLKGLGALKGAKHHHDDEAAKEQKDEKKPGFDFAGVLAFLAVSFGLGFVLTLVAPQRMKRVEDAIRTQPVRNGLYGILALLASIPLTLILCITLVGIPLAVLMWLALPLALLAGVPAIANVIGGALPTGKLRKTQALALALGLLVLAVAANLPVLGPVVIVACTFLGIGAMLRTRFGQPPKGMPVPDFSSAQTSPL